MFVLLSSAGDDDIIDSILLHKSQQRRNKATANVVLKEAELVQNVETSVFDRLQNVGEKGTFSLPIDRLFF